MDLRTIVLAMSPRAAEALERHVVGEKPLPNDTELLRQVGDELCAQLNGLALHRDVRPTVISEDSPAPAVEFAKRMAAAGAQAVGAA